MGSNGIMVLVAFYDGQRDLQDSDSKRQAFARDYLSGLRFLYKDALGDDKKVCDPKMVFIF
jgi:hypothetical protein